MDCTCQNQRQEVKLEVIVTSATVTTKNAVNTMEQCTWCVEHQSMLCPQQQKQNWEACLWNVKKAMGHPQEATPATTDNSTVEGIANNSIKQQQSRAADMSQ